MDPNEEYTLKEVEKLLELYTLEELLENSEYTLAAIITHLLTERLIEYPDVSPL